MRGKLEFDFGPLNLLASASYNESDSNCCQSALVISESPILDRVAFPVVARPHSTDVSSNANNVANTDLAIYSLEANYDLDAATITSITAYQNYNFFGGFDVDAINNPVPIYAGGNGLAPFYANFDVNDGPFDIGQFSQELRIASAVDQRLTTWLVFTTTRPRSTGPSTAASLPVPPANRQIRASRSAPSVRLRWRLPAAPLRI